MSYPAVGISVRFWAKITKTPDCWKWGAGKDKDGYGLIVSHTIPHRNIRAHRVSWELHFGKIPEGLWVLHHCDNPECCNPAHLYLGGQTENMRDMVERKRGANGVKNVNAKLNWQIVRQIRALYTGAWGQHAALAKQFGVTRPTVSYLLNGLTWRE